MCIIIIINDNKNKENNTSNKLNVFDSKLSTSMPSWERCIFELVIYDCTWYLIGKHNQFIFVLKCTCKFGEILTSNL